VDLSSKCLVLIQSRLSSSRLPGKALLPIGDLPMVVLTAKRASNKGRDVRILTSTDRSDDAICEVLEKHEIDYFRGSLDHVLKRFYDALVDCHDATKVFRLTADNVLPDGAFLDEMEAAFDLVCPDIMRCDSVKSCMPYGLAAELTTVGWIRKAYENTEDAFDIEHVTPYIHRHGISKCFQSSVIRGYQNLRVTIDSFDDYLSVRSLFVSSKSPCNESVIRLIHNFQRMKYRPYYDPAPKPMTLGCVQFGLDYGIANANGKVPESESIAIIRHAITEGIDFIDTAAAYGDSEKIIAKALNGGWSNRVKIITKLFPFNEKELSQKDHSSLSLMVRNSFLQSCINLEVDHIDTLMLHRAQQLNNSYVCNELKQLREEGLINRIGVSVQSPLELEFVLRNQDVSIIQMPYNILDYRWDAMIDLIKREREQRSIIIHARSVLLQGLLCSDDDNNWMIAGVDNFSEIIHWLETKYKQHEKMSISDLCIGYVNSQDWVDSVVIGVDSDKNLFSNLQSVSMPLMSNEALDDLTSLRPFVDADALNPANWRVNV
jgi:aryl-alcohol dehydrogenase-like predicted oxidoreductase/spore coat polysaccharide biosynthesis protein SpsF (cytidylyltransferase family)